MDPLTLAASIVGPVQSSLKSLWILDNCLKADSEHLGEIEPNPRKLQIAVTCLQIISKHLPTNDVLPGVDRSLTMCMQSGENLAKIAKDQRIKSKSQFSKRLSQEVDVFADSVASLRTISEEARMEYLMMSMKKPDDMNRLGRQYQTRFIKEVEETKHDLLGHMSTIMDVLDKQTQSVFNFSIHNKALSDDNAHVAELLSQLKVGTDVSHDNSDKRQDLDEIRARLEKTFTQKNAFEFNQSNEFVYNIPILSRKDGSPDAASSTHCCATLDTRCHDNWVSIGIIERAGLHDSMEIITDPDEFKSFSGHVMKTQGQIELTFFLAMANGSSQQTGTETFYVFDQLPVDLVLGKGFVAKQFAFLSKPALGLVKQGEFTQEEIRIIETSMKEQGAANAEISSLRRAAGASGWNTPRQPDLMLQANTRSPSGMVPISRLRISSTQVSEGSGPEDDEVVQEPEIMTGSSVDV